MTFLCYTSLVRSLRSIIRTTKYKSKVIYPLIPYRISLVLSKTKISRIAYKEFQKSIRPNHAKGQQRLEEQWKRDVGHFQLGSVYDMSSVTKNTYLQAFHFLVISRIIPTKQFLHAIGRSENNICTFCSSSIETLSQLFLGLFPYKTIPYRYQISTS